MGSTKRNLAALLAVALTVSLAGVSSAVPYDFEGLTAGALAGQDNWKKFNAAYNAGAVTTGVGVNTTTVGRSSNETSGSQPTGVSRINDGAWGYTADFSTATVFQMDRRFGSSVYITFGNDFDNDGTIEWNDAEEPGWLFSGSDIEVQISSSTGTWAASTPLSLPANTDAGD